MKPFFFGAADRKLFGAYHPPGLSASRPTAVLLCYPTVGEYGGSHWACRRLADALSRAGMHVLRFDYSGTGDSWGDTTNVSVEDWVQDVQFAARELTSLSRARRLHVIGLRLGGFFAMEASRRGLAIHTLVLWHPVARGSDYVEALRAGEHLLKVRFMHQNCPPAPTELFGVPVSPSLVEGLRAIDMAAGEVPPTERTLIVSSGKDTSHRQVARALAGSGARCEVLDVPTDDIGNLALQDAPYLATASIPTIVSALSADAVTNP